MPKRCVLSDTVAMCLNGTCHQCVLLLVLLIGSIYSDCTHRWLQIV